MTEPGTARSGLITVERNGENLTGIATGIASNSFAIRRLSSGRRENGLLFRDGTFSEWQTRGLVEDDGQIYITGPAVSGVFLGDAIEDEQRDRLGDLAGLAAMMAALDEREQLPELLHTRAFVLGDDGSILLLPPEIIRSVGEHADLAGKLRIADAFLNPDAPADPVHFLASLAYRVLTGALPFEASSLEEMHLRIRTGKPVVPVHRRHDLNPQVSGTLAAILGGETEDATVAAFAAHLAAWRRDGVTVVLSEEERTSLAERAAEEIDKLDRSFSRNEKVRTNWRRWAIIATVAVVIAIVPATILRNALQPRATAGFAPAEVVQAFYMSFNTLDHMTMEDAVVDHAAREYIREVTTLYVIDKQRMGVEFRSSFVDAKAWRESGMPDIPDGTSPYGVNNLVIEDLPAGEGEYAFRVSYERWTPLAQEDPEGPPLERAYTAYLYTDELKLRLDRDDWVIYEQVTTSSEEIDIDALFRAVGQTTD